MSKYAELGQLMVCWRCGDSVLRYRGEGEEVVLDLRDAPSDLVPDGLRWRVSGHGTAINLGWTNPTDLARVRHADVCHASPRTDLSRLIAHWQTRPEVAAARRVLQSLMSPDADLRRTPSREEARPSYVPAVTRVLARRVSSPMGIFGRRTTANGRRSSGRCVMPRCRPKSAASS